MFARLRRREEGAIAVELALLVPVLFLLLTVGAEIGRALYQANAVEKGVRGGALFAARSILPLAPGAVLTVENLVRTGDPTGASAVLASGWLRPGATLRIDTAETYDTGAALVPIVTIEATVPFDPLMPGVMRYLGLGDYSFRAHHQQPYVGN